MNRSHRFCSNGLHLEHPFLCRNQEGHVSRSVILFVWHYAQIYWNKQWSSVDSASSSIWPTSGCTFLRRQRISPFFGCLHSLVVRKAAIFPPGNSTINNCSWTPPNSVPKVLTYDLRWEFFSWTMKFVASIVYGSDATASKFFMQNMRDITQLVIHQAWCILFLPFADCSLSRGQMSRDDPWLRIAISLEENCCKETKKDSSQMDSSQCDPFPFLDLSNRGLVQIPKLWSSHNNTSFPATDDGSVSSASPWVTTIQHIS